MRILSSTLFFSLVLAVPAAEGVRGAAAAPTPASIARIGEIQIPFGSHPDFDIAADEARNTLHLVFRNGGTLHYVASRDGGATWSQPEALGNGLSPRLAIDAVGALHLAYAIGDAKTTTGDGIQYRRRGERGWEASTDVFGPRSPDAFKHIAPRIAVDGNGNVHIIAWKLVRVPDQWRALSRCAYRRLARGAEGFEPSEEFRLGRDAPEGGGLHGELIVDPRGDLHVLFASWWKEWKTTHFSRARDGTWSTWTNVYTKTASDFALSGAIDREGVLHLAGFLAKDREPICWGYFNNRRSRTELDLVHSVPEKWEIGNDLLLRPNGDIWIVRGNWQGKGDIEPWRGRLMHFSATSGNWSEPRAISAPGHRNLDGKHGHVPKFVAYQGKVKLFYAEDAPGKDFGLFVQTFEL